MVALGGAECICPKPWKGRTCEVLYRYGWRELMPQTNEQIFIKKERKKERKKEANEKIKKRSKLINKYINTTNN